MSAEQDIDYNVVLNDLRAKRDKLDAAIVGIETMLGIKAQTHNDEQPTKAPLGSTVSPGDFLGMTIVDAAIKYLTSKRQNQKTEEIADALKLGGMVAAGNFVNTVGSVLNRNYSQGGEIVRVGRAQWGLASWHPRLRKKSSDQQYAERLQELGQGAPGTTQEPVGATTLDGLPQSGLDDIF
jgi:hypothetical protein